MRCIIIAAGDLGNVTVEQIAPGPQDFVICCDAGLNHARSLGIHPDLVLGDFDSYRGEIPSDLAVQRFEKDKDDTDTLLAVRHGLRLGYREFLLVAGTGGRLDHTYANLQTLAFLLQEGAVGILLGGDERVALVRNGSVRIPKREGFTLSVFSYSEVSRGVCESGVRFPLCNATLTNANPLGVSNRITEAHATISVSDGTLLILECREN